ncbi:YceI family protein [Specibacter sp. NPDC057265]|uniref:YceI family protein n=1 Tax=Specibacter sp. NPDC057265 TaxID=3346075 RepID=UPI00362E941C
MRKKWLIILSALVLAAAAVWGGSILYANAQNEQAPEELALSTPSSPAATDPGTDAATSGAALTGTWQTQGDSQAGYRVDEVLNGQNVTVVGRSSQINATVTVEGTKLTAAAVEVDMTSVKTDNDRRDNQFQGILKTAEFPTATFTLNQAVDIAAIGSGPLSVMAPGELTIAGVTKEVTAQLTAQLNGANVEVQGTIPLAFADFGIAAPNLGFVQVEDTGSIEMLLKLSR